MEGLVKGKQIKKSSISLKPDISPIDILNYNIATHSISGTFSKQLVNIEYLESGGGNLQKTTDIGNTTDNDLEIVDHTKGNVLTSPDGSRWRIQVDNNGSLSATKL